MHELFLGPFACLQVAGARRELEERLGHERVAFLRSRSRARPGAGPSAAAHADSVNVQQVMSPNHAHSRDGDALQERNCHKVLLYMRSQAARTAAQDSAGAAGTLRSSHAAPLPGSSGVAAHATAGGSAAVERLRFSLEGRPLGLAPEEGANPDARAVVQRDLLRCALGFYLPTLIPQGPQTCSANILAGSLQECCDAATGSAQLHLRPAHVDAHLARALA